MHVQTPNFPIAKVSLYTAVIVIPTLFLLFHLILAVIKLPLV